MAGTGPLPTDAIERLFRERERIFSRFLADSELNRVNESSGHIVSVSALFATTLQIALEIAEQTRGDRRPDDRGRTRSGGLHA